jgi:hypothetical protein
MSLTALAWVVSYFASMALSLMLNPLYGALGYLLEYYMRPDLRWWGNELPRLRWNLMIAFAFGLTFLLRRRSLTKLTEVANPSLRWLLSLGTLMVVVTLTFAVNTSASTSWMVQWMKLAVIFPLLLTGVIRTRTAFNMFIAAHMLGGFGWGWAAWQDPTRVAGRLINIGSGDSLNDNEASAHLLTVLPFAIIYLLTEKDLRWRSVALLATPFIINTLILCNSRGAMVGMAAALVAAFYLVGSGRRLRMVGAGVATVAALLYMADAPFWERQQTTAEHTDNSSQERLITWQGGIHLVIDHPLGVGGRGFHQLSPKYIPDVVFAHGGDPRAPHNTYVMVASEWGVLGLICYLGLYASTFWMLRQVKKHARGDPDRFYYWRALAIQLGLVAYMACSMFTDRLYGEAGYWMIALAYSLYRMQATEQASELAAPAEAAVSTIQRIPRVNYPLPSTRPV